MKFSFAACAALTGFVLTLSAGSQVNPEKAQDSKDQPLRIAGTFSLPTLKEGNFDHFAVDLKRNRLFVTPEQDGMVLVLDASSGEAIHKLAVQKPHAILYRSDIDRLYVTDGLDGSVRVFDGQSYQQVARVPVLKDADAIGYDISKKMLYVANGGKDVGEKVSHLSVIDTDSNQKKQDIVIEGETLEAMALDAYRPRLYLNDTAKNSLVVVNRYTHSKIAEWPITSCKGNVAIALDEQRQRLFLGCRSNQIVVLDSNTGAEVQKLEIHGGVDDVIYDLVSRRIYASGDGYIDVFSQSDLNHYVSLGSVATGVTLCRQDKRQW
ncbi:YncE family protein [Terriglobus sp. YAF25]|uniref:YncE family protein n=1 Tax=Terriglobus sp. YAF25 TaxID=3233080 RepID=UPI003F9E5494